LKVTERFSKELTIAEDINSKCGVLPLIMQPKAIKNLYFFY
jgi:hypothetical protein